jgi:hypothetical protein
VRLISQSFEDLQIYILKKKNTQTKKKMSYSFAPIQIHPKEEQPYSTCLIGKSNNVIASETIKPVPI